MKVILREDESGVSEVIGTILILGMTVVLFSTIIIWVSNIPTPTPQTRLDMESQMTPVAGGFPSGVNITIRHLGGDRLFPTPTRIYVTSQRGTGLPTTVIVQLHLYNAALNGLIDGTDSIWDAGERWSYKSFALDTGDQITVTVVDITKSIVNWQSTINAATGARPPVFVDKWTDGIPSTSGIDPVNEHLGFAVYAKVIDPDNDLNRNSVYATLSIWFGTGNACEQPQKMRDDGVFPDRVANDGIFTLGSNVCVNAPFPNLNWDGSIILLNATDMKGNTATSRLVLTVEQPIGGGGGSTPIPWQYIGFVQVVPGGWWGTNLNNPYNSATTFSLYRVTKTQLVNTGGPLFHLKLSNHGNRTIFFDGYTGISFFRTSGGVAPPSIFIIQPKDPNKAANAASPGGTAAYPGTGAQNNFAYASVVDINPSNPDGGGLPSEIFIAAANPFTSVSLPTAPGLVSGNTNAGSFQVTIIISGIAGPASMTYGQILTRWGATYNPYDHLNDADLTTRTQWYSQLLEYSVMTIY
ncbi:MAG TPA: type IV pilin N-terminal domain-containing protein [Thermoplasmata archaeon]|nr:type IV pilin N-terminal domain-containing protein [Thermoplasmata archaeon]